MGGFIPHRLRQLAVERRWQFLWRDVLPQVVLDAVARQSACRCSCRCVLSGSLQVVQHSNTRLDNTTGMQREAGAGSLMRRHMTWSAMRTASAGVLPQPPAASTSWPSAPWTVTRASKLCLHRRSSATSDQLNAVQQGGHVESGPCQDTACEPTQAGPCQ